MFKRFLKKTKKEDNVSYIPWEDTATQALDQAVSQAPVPGPLKNKIRSELQKAAEDNARKNGHEEVTPEDLMQGMLAKMPTGMRKKVEDAIQAGPEGIKKLEEEMKKR